MISRMSNQARSLNNTRILAESGLKKYFSTESKEDMFTDIASAIPIKLEDSKLTSKSINQFFEDGFLVIDDVFSKDEAENLKNMADIEINKAQKLGELDWPLHRLCATRSTQFRNLCSDKRLIEILKPIVGENIQLQHSKFAIKQPGEEKGIINWHQDFAFFPHTNDSLVAIAISLNDVTPENGGMVMIKGSHKEGLLNHRYADGTFAEKCLDEKILTEKERFHWVCPKQGSISIHHCLTAHCSNDNLTSDTRYMVVFEYRASDAYQLADGIWDDTGLQVNGKSVENIRIGGRFLKKSSDDSIILPLPRSDRYGSEFPFGHAYNQVGKLGKESSPYFKKS